MSKYLKLFGNHNQYSAYTADTANFILPNVSLCLNENEVHFNAYTPPPAHDYSQDYFTIVPYEDCDIRFSCPSESGIRVSTNGGETWSEEYGEYTVSVLANQKVLVKGNMPLGAYSYEGSDPGYFLSVGSEYEMEGNILSLFYGDDFKTPRTITTDGAFARLFPFDSTLVSAENLSLPTTVSTHCYHGMFEACYGLLRAPQLPATTLAEGCYTVMFSMCYDLTTAPQLPATTLADYCYDGMFQDCYSLTTAPELPATTLAEGCYSTMFLGCSGLVTAPQLPATTLAEGCYGSMFENCINLTTVPELPATTLAEGCYSTMFQNCTNLNYVKCLATDITATDCTDYWLNYVSETGTFVKNANMSSWGSGESGIPSNWTVVDAS